MDKDEELAKKRVQARMGFVVHLAIYIGMNAGMFAIWLLSGQGYPWFMLPMFGWGIGVLAHALTLAIGPGSAAERRAIDKELRRLHSAAR